VRMRRAVIGENQYSERGLYATGMLISLMAYFVTGAFISVLYYPPFWYLLAFVVTMSVLASNEEDKDSSSTRGRLTSHMNNQMQHSVRKI
jgi:hypothetical protein